MGSPSRLDQTGKFRSDSSTEMAPSISSKHSSKAGSTEMMELWDFIFLNCTSHWKGETEGMGKGSLA